MVHWVKVNYERNEYMVDLDRLGVFSCSANGRITFWLPDSSIPIIVNRQNNQEDYQKIWDYVEHLLSPSPMGNWLKISYDRNEYLIDLDRINAFCHSPNRKLTFWLPESSIPIIISPQTDPEGYSKVIDFIHKKTGQSFST